MLPIIIHFVLLSRWAFVKRGFIIDAANSTNALLMISLDCLDNSLRIKNTKNPTNSSISIASISNMIHECCVKLESSETIFRRMMCVCVCDMHKNASTETKHTEIVLIRFKLHMYFLLVSSFPSTMLFSLQSSEFYQWFQYQMSDSVVCVCQFAVICCNRRKICARVNKCAGKPSTTFPIDPLSSSPHFKKVPYDKSSNTNNTNNNGNVIEKLLPFHTMETPDKNGTEKRLYDVNNHSMSFVCIEPHTHTHTQQADWLFFYVNKKTNDLYVFLIDLIYFPWLIYGIAWYSRWRQSIRSISKQTSSSTI